MHSGYCSIKLWSEAKPILRTSRVETPSGPSKIADKALSTARLVEATMRTLLFCLTQYWTAFAKTHFVLPVPGGPQMYERPEVSIVCTAKRCSSLKPESNVD